MANPFPYALRGYKIARGFPATPCLPWSFGGPIEPDSRILLVDPLIDLSKGKRVTLAERA